MRAFLFSAFSFLDKTTENFSSHSNLISSCSTFEDTGTFTNRKVALKYALKKKRKEKERKEKERLRKTTIVTSEHSKPKLLFFFNTLLHMCVCYLHL